MRLVRAHVQSYRSIYDSGVFEVEAQKTILVGANEAGKSALLMALQQLKRPAGVASLDVLRDFPRSKYHLIREKKIDPDKTEVVTGWYQLDASDRDDLPTAYHDVVYKRTTYASGRTVHEMGGEPALPTWNNLTKDMARLLAHLRRSVKAADGTETVPGQTVADSLEKATASWQSNQVLVKEYAEALRPVLQKCLPHVDEHSNDEEARYDRLLKALDAYKDRDAAFAHLDSISPTYVLFNNYFRVRPRIQLDHLAKRVEQKLLDDEQYDYGNLCLLKLLGFTPRELADLASEPVPQQADGEAVKRYQKKLDERQYQLNAASVRLTSEIKAIWAPDESRGEAARLRITADGMYLKLVVEDSIGVEVELDQRSEGFQWLVSFFVVFFAEAGDKHRNALLLLDEPGMSLHGLKQREFRTTLSKLSETNQAIYTTHSPFLVGPDEMDLVRVVEMRDRTSGTKVSTTIAASDSPALLPLQEALGYDLAQSLFAQQRNLVLEGLTDFWYIEAVSQMFTEAGQRSLEEKIALIPAGNAGKVVYYATILHAHKLKVVALLDSDAAGDQAAKQDTLVHRLGQKSILRTKDFYSGSVTKVEIEDLLRETLIAVAKNDLAWDVTSAAAQQHSAGITVVLESQFNDFSKYKLAKAFLRWSRTHKLVDLQTHEREAFAKLFAQANKVLR